MCASELNEGRRREGMRAGGKRAREREREREGKRRRIRISATLTERKSSMEMLSSILRFEVEE